jgi:amino acid transporter
MDNFPDPAMTEPISSGERSLVRAIGTWALAAGVINVTVGGGIFRLPADVAGALGAAAPIAYVVCAIAMGLIVLCFAEAGSRVSMTVGRMRMSSSRSVRTSAF